MATQITAAAGANAGTSPPAPVLGNIADDARGALTFGTGTSPAAGAQVVLTFACSWSAYPGIALPIPHVTPGDSATAALGPWYATMSSDGRQLTLGCTNAPTASQANTVYKLGYSVTG